MKIEALNNHLFIVNEVKTNNSKNKENKVLKDKVEISEQAKQLQKSKLSNKLDIIRNRIENKFYNKKEVINKIAEEILKDIKSGK